MKQITHAEYCRNVTVRSSAGFKFRPLGESYYVVNGEVLTESQMDELYPIKNINIINWRKKNMPKAKTRIKVKIFLNPKNQLHEKFPADTDYFNHLQKY